MDTFSGGHGVVTREDRTWEDGYRKRWDTGERTVRFRGVLLRLPADQLVVLSGTEGGIQESVMSTGDTS